MVTKHKRLNKPLPTAGAGAFWLIFLPFVSGLVLYSCSVFLPNLSYSRFFPLALAVLVLASSSWLGWLAAVPLFAFFGCCTAERICEPVSIFLSEDGRLGPILAVLIWIPALFLSGFLSVRRSLALLASIRRNGPEHVLRPCLWQILLFSGAVGSSFLLARF